MQVNKTKKQFEGSIFKYFLVEIYLKYQYFAFGLKIFQNFPSFYNFFV
jgi:hypothetical protein